MANMFAKLILIKKGSKDFSGGPVADSVLPKQRACLGSICGQGTRPHMLQPRVYMPQWKLKLPHAATKTQHSQINKIFKKYYVCIMYICVCIYI